MELQLLEEVKQLNPWLANPSNPLFFAENFIPRVQTTELLNPDWDKVWLILTGPRRAGKTTLGKFLANALIQQKRYSQLLYLNCDYLSIRQWLNSPLFLKEAFEYFALSKPILFIDEVQRIENPGLLLKAIHDLNYPIKHIATGSSQLEMKSKVQEFLTGRQLVSLVLPLSHEEWSQVKNLEEILIFGTYPQVLQSTRKEIQLMEIFNNYIEKDIIEILKIGQPDILQNLLTLIAHQTGQLVNYQQLAVDCKINVTTIRNYLDVLEKTYVIAKIKPFVGNKRTEITSNPIYYFIDNGFRNITLRNFLPLASRQDAGLLVENFIFQELYKFKSQHFLLFDIYYWRTKSGAEVDFVLYKNEEYFLPIEAKFRNFTQPTLTRGFRSFIEAYRPKTALIITKTFLAKMTVNDCIVHFVPLSHLSEIFSLIKAALKVPAPE